MAETELPKDLHAYTKECWNAMADEWAKQHGEIGNDFHLQIVSPTAEKLLAIRPGQDEVLEIACGSGVFAKRLQELGAKYIVATDFSPESIRITMKRCEGLPNVEFFCLDAVDGQSIVEKFGEARFDKAVCNMALMDMSEIDPLFAAMFKILKPGGSFVFTIMHPVFNGNSPVKGIEEIQDPATHQLKDVFYIKLTEYMHWKPTLAFPGYAGQTVKQIYFHRPLHELFEVIFRNGFVVDGFEESAYKSESQETGRKRQVDWCNFTQFPLVLGMRCRKI